MKTQTKIKVRIADSEYTINKAVITAISQMTAKEKLFEIELETGEGLNHEPGQFVEISLFGAGESPISFASLPIKRRSFEICVRDAGRVTHALHKLPVGAEVGIRGPFGKGFPVRLMEGNDVIVVAGGIGIVPLRPLIHFIIANRRKFGKVTILMGCKTPDTILFGAETAEWSKRPDINFSCTVDKAGTDWKGNVGMITSLIPGITIQPGQTYTVVVGPPVMYKYVIRELLNRGVADDRIIISLERHMKCGLGKCGHCQIGKYYCCQDGPVFNYAAIKDIEEAF